MSEQDVLDQGSQLGQPAARILWLLWTLATFVGVTIGCALYGVVGKGAFVWVIEAGGFGLAIGILQSGVLWQVTRSTNQWALISIQWTLSSVAGWSVGAIAGVVGTLIITLGLYFMNVGDYALIYRTSSSPLPMILIGLWGGLCVSVLQQHIPSARLNLTSQWTRASTIGWVVAWLVGWGAGYLVPGSENVKWLILRRRWLSSCQPSHGVELSPRMKEGYIVSHFRDKVTIVTGGASGIGRALCEELGQRGARVLVSDISVVGAEQVASAITATGGQARAMHLDVTQAADVQRLIEETASEQGRLDFMFNNAGICMVGEVRDMDLERWQQLIDVNLWGVIYGTTAAYAVMLEQGFGHIVNIASADGLMPFPMMTAYSTLKDIDALRGELLQSPLMMDAARCARVILRGVERNRRAAILSQSDRSLARPVGMMTSALWRE